MSVPSPPNLTLESFFDTFEIVCQIGSGCFGQIFRVASKADQRHYALKKVLVDSGYCNRELSILLLTQHTDGVLNLIAHLLVPVQRTREYLASPHSPKTSLAANEMVALSNVDKKFEDVLYLITKCYPTNLRSALLERKVPQPGKRALVRKLCQGVRNLHRKGICHRDIKSENILVDVENNEICLGDLGSAKEFTPQSKGGIAYIVSRPYRAPELLLGHTSYDLSIDLWSLGCVIFEVLSLSKTRLFTGDSGKAVLLEIIGLLGPPTPEDLVGLAEKRNISVVSDVRKRSLDDLIEPSSDPLLVSLMKECLRWDPSKRADLDLWLAKLSYN
jgi:glycogen synthase kinase 3 beta